MPPKITGNIFAFELSRVSMGHGSPLCAERIKRGLMEIGIDVDGSDRLKKTLSSIEHRGGTQGEAHLIWSAAVKAAGMQTAKARKRMADEFVKAGESVAAA